MPAEAWVALVLGILAIIGTLVTTTWYLSGRLSVVDGMKGSIDELKVAVSQIAVDRERGSALERRVSKLEQWYDELRRGVGRINQ
jgi:hypothetical protein